LASADSKVKFEIINTKLLGQMIDRSSGTINLRSYNIETELNYASGKFEAEAKGIINVRDFNNPVYDIKGKVANLDISQFTQKIEDKSSHICIDLTAGG
jgi:hypothetical protein